jgi:DNA-binding CsgD family transcriptional regulator
MSPRDFEALSALFDGERACAQRLLAVLRRPAALEFLAHMARLRLWVQQDAAAVPSESWCRVMRRMLALADELATGSPTVRSPARNVAGSTLGAPQGAVARTSRRQAEILKCLLDGCSEKEVGDRLTIKPSTVHSHVKRLHQKLGVHNRGQLLAAVLRMSAGIKNDSR